MDFSQENLDGENTCDPDSQAYPEVEVSKENCSRVKWNTCKKSQGHDGFIAWPIFVKDPTSHLFKAEINYDTTTVEYIKTSGELVVKLVVDFVSLGRPKALYRSLFRNLGKYVRTNGSGIVIGVEPSIEICRCYNCSISTKTKKTWEICICTATHVVFDHTEAIWTTAELFYDTDDITDLKELFVNFVEKRSIDGDSCVLKCVTCDEKLCHDLIDLLTKQKQLYAALPLCERPIAVIISHPHGMYKHISWGPCQVADTAQDQIFWMTSYKYKTPTCPGSSGAPVFLLNSKCKERHTSLLMGNFICHSGANNNGNYSGEYTLSTFKSGAIMEKGRNMKQPVMTKDKHFNGGSLEADLHKHVTGCRKNPGHKGFIPLKDFSINCLPSRYHDCDDLFEFIQTLAALTCQCKTTFTSLERLEFYPGTKIEYPFYKNRGSDVMRTGTGSITSVVKQLDSFCTCLKCQLSETPRKVHYFVYVTTAKHVVFDDNEARETRMVFGFDDNKSYIISLDGWSIVYSDLEGDFSILQHVTCDLELAEELSNMLTRLHNLDRNICLNYSVYNSVEKLTVIVSHPHGCPKQVSVGQWTIMDVKQQDKSYDYVKCKFWYTTCTCPGSSGAAVYVLGQVFSQVYRRYIPTHVHSCSLGTDWNRSGCEVENLYNKQIYQS